MCKMGQTGGGLILSGEVGKSGRKVCCPFSGVGGSTSKVIGMGMTESPDAGSSLIPAAIGDTSGSHWPMAAAASVCNIGA